MTIRPYRVLQHRRFAGAGLVVERCLAQPSRRAVRLLDRLVAGRVDEDVFQPIQELVTRRSLHRPIAGQALAERQDLLYEDGNILTDCGAKTLEIFSRVGQPVDVVDADAVDQSGRDQLQCQRMRLTKNLFVLDAYTDEIVDIKKATIADLSSAQPAAPRHEPVVLQVQQRLEAFATGGSRIELHE